MRYSMLIMASIIMMGTASATAQTTTRRQKAAFSIARGMAKDAAKKHFMAVRRTATGSHGIVIVKKDGKATKAMR